MKVVLCTNIVVITSNLFQRITLNMLCSVPCCEVQQFFFFWLSMGTRWVIRTFNFKEVSNVGGNLHNHCSDNLKPDVKDSSEYAVLCSLLRSSPVYLFIYFFFLWLAMVSRSNFNSLTVQKSFHRTPNSNPVFENQSTVVAKCSALTVFQMEFQTIFVV